MKSKKMRSHNKKKNNKKNKNNKYKMSKKEIEIAKENINKLITYSFKDGIKKLIIFGIVGMIILKFIEINENTMIQNNINVLAIEIIAQVIFMIIGAIIAKRCSNKMEKLRLIRVYIKETS